MPSIQITVSGNVQGVFFRAFVREHAIALRLRGWVENLPDGSVLVRAEGPDEDLDRLVHACRTGPARARVQQVDVRDADPLRVTGFDIRR
jgi:acylphosphatase